MKKVLHQIFPIAIFLFSALNAHAVEIRQTWTWTGAAMDGVWATPANWSVSPSDIHQTFPHNYNDALNNKQYVADVVINGSATLNLTGTYYVNSLNITSGTVNIYTATTSLQILYISGVTGNAPSSFNVAAGAMLKIGENSMAGTYIDLNNDLVTCNISGTIDILNNGTGANNSRISWSSDFAAPFATINVKAGGKIILSGPSSSITGGTSTKLIFESGSTFEIKRDGGTLPGAFYQTGSKILISDGTTNRVTNPGIATNSFVGDNTVVYNGDIEFNTSSGPSGQGGAPNQWGTNSSTNQFLGKLTMKKGYIRFVGSGLTSSPALTFGSIDFPDVVGSATLDLRSLSADALNMSVAGNVSMAGSGKTMNVNATGNNMTLTVNGNLIQSGGTINLSEVTGNGKLVVNGNIDQTGGVITETGASLSSALVFGGGNAQTATFAGTGLGGDALNIEINKPSNNVTMLSSMTIPKDLILTSGHLILGGNNITVNNLATGGKAISHVVTDGTGALTINNVLPTGKEFPVGISISSYDPVNIQNTVAANNFTVSVGSSITAGVPASYVNIIPRQWEIVSTSAGATLAFTPGTGTANAPEIGHFTGGAWVFSASTTTSPTYTGVFTSFSPFIIANQALPVELVSFTGKKVANVNVLNWQTASEKNNSHFDIERSNNGETGWAKIGMVKGNGNSVITQNYSFSDNTPLSTLPTGRQVSYYRLKQIDFDGKFEYSNVVSLVDKKGKFNIASVAPNPTKETSTILFESAKNENISVTLTDVSGRIILTQNLSGTEGVNTLNVNMSALNNGLYIMSLRNSEQVLIQKLIKQ